MHDMTNVELDCSKSQEMCEKVPNAFLLAKSLCRTKYTQIF